MALAYNHEEITARELKPALFELDGISRETIEAHYKLYQGYVNKRNEILGKLGDVDPRRANQVYSDFRSLKVDLSFADRRDQEPRDLLRAPRRQRRRARPASSATSSSATSARSPTGRPI